jgi:hypothetical protein
LDVELQPIGASCKFILIAILITLNFSVPKKLFKTPLSYQVPPFSY